MDSAKQQLTEKLKTAKNVLVTVSRDPTVDQLSALLGLSLLLNKQGKHCAAVFSGNIPSTIDFLKPENTIEKTTDSLRDFIIALDKNKADKLRYKVEDNIVRIFITPYRTSITQSDLDFSQGDFNVDVVVALGVHEQTDLDEVITSHGRILHDAVVASINVTKEGGLGSINWHEPSASSLSELVTELAQAMGDKLLDEQISTALLTGIVSETDRFSNDKTSPNTMSISAALMSAGANQQLIATKLEAPEPPAPAQPARFNISSDQNYQAPQEANDDDNGTLKITHDSLPVSDADERQEAEESAREDIAQAIELPDPDMGEAPLSPAPESPNATDEAPLPPAPEPPVDPVEENVSRIEVNPNNRLISEPPTLSGTLTSSTFDNEMEPSTDPFSLPDAEMPKLFEKKSDRITPLPFSPYSEGSNANLPPASPPVRPDFIPSVPEPPIVIDEAPLPPAPEPPVNEFTPPPSDWNPPSPPPPPPPSDTPPSNFVSPAPEQASASGFPQSGSPTDTLSQIEKEVDSLHVYQPDLVENISHLEKVMDSPHAYQADIPDTLSHLEEAVNSPHLNPSKPTSDTDSAREEVNRALSSADNGDTQTPLEALNSQPLGAELHPLDSSSVESAPQATPPTEQQAPGLSSGPPPVAPPIPFEFGKTST